MKRTLRLLDLCLGVDCDEPELVEPFLAVFSTQAGGPPPGDACREIHIQIDAGAGVARSDGRVIPLAPEPLRAAHVYNLLYWTLVRSLRDVYLLHAAAVARWDRAFLVAGPAGAGKTSMARALLRRGFRLLSDDLAPLAIEDGCVQPFPRRIGLVRDERNALQPGYGSGVELGDKTFVEPRSLGARVETRPLRPAAIVLVNPYVAPEVGAVAASVGLIGEADELVRRLGRIAGVGLEATPGGPGLTRLELRLEGARAFAAVDRELSAAGDAGRLLFHVRHYGDERRYAERPELRPVAAAQAAVELLREALNRDPRSGLMQRHDGSLAAACYELGGLIGGAACLRLVPADVESTADLLAQRFAEAVRRAATG